MKIIEWGIGALLLLLLATIALGCSPTQVCRKHNSTITDAQGNVSKYEHEGCIWGSPTTP